LRDWQYIEAEAAEQFCRIEYFSLKKLQDGQEIEFTVAVKEYLQPPDPAMRFFAQADKAINQQAAPYTPCGWGPNLSTALWECMQGIRKFPYQP
jgi:hypothetical protein